MAIGDIAPGLKMEIRDTIVEQVFSKALQKQAAWMDKIIIQNDTVQGVNTGWLTHRGKQYHLSAVVPDPRRSYHMNRLDPTLRTAMQEYCDAELDLEHQMERAKAAIAAVLNASNHVADWFALLPDTLHQPLRDMEMGGRLPEPSPLVQPLSQERLEKARAKIHDGMVIVKSRLLLDLLD